MSTADDISLLAMQAARLSPASIALTMGWSEARTARRLRLLNGAVCPMSGSGQGAATPPVETPDPEDEPEEDDYTPVEPGHGLVTRAFAVLPSGFGADCRLSDGRRVFTLTGKERQALGRRIRVAQGEGVWTMIGEAGDA